MTLAGDEEVPSSAAAESGRSADAARPMKARPWLFAALLGVFVLWIVSLTILNRVA